MDKALKIQIRDLIGNDKTEQALDLFNQWANTTSDRDLQNNLTNTKSRLSSLKRQKGMGTISPKDAEITKNQIVDSILNALDEAANVSIAPPPVTPIVPPTFIQVAATDGRKTILFMGANPPGTKYLQLEVEHSRIAQKLGNKFNLETEKLLSAGDIPELISKFSPNIIHFSGHGKDPNSSDHGATNDTSRGGAYDLPSDYEQRGGIVVFDDDKRGLAIIEDESLEYLFDSTINDLGIPLEVVVFNSCYSESQAKAIGKYVPFVVGSSRALDDDLALAFAEGFYFGISEGKIIEKAFVTGKQKVVLKKPKSKDLIVLYKNGVKTDL